MCGAEAGRKGLTSPLPSLLRDLRSSRAGVSGGDGALEFIPGYRVVGLISQGGMGLVYRAIQRSLDRPVALKVLHPHLSQDAEFVARFRQEAHLGALLDHPNLVRVYDAGELSGHLYYSMELIESCDLGVLLELRGRLQGRFAARLVIQVASALEAAHAASVLHGDVKPANILLSPEGRVKLVDLGLARLTGQPDCTATREGTIVGTPNYMSPEQIDGLGDLTERSDIYMLGATLLHLVSGEPPFGQGLPEQIFTRVVRGGPAIPGGLHPGLKAIITRCMERDPDSRYPSASALRAALSAHLQERESPGRRRDSGWLPGTGPRGAPWRVQAAARAAPERASPDRWSDLTEAMSTRRGSDQLPATAPG